MNKQEQTRNDVIYLEREIVSVNGKEYANYFVNATFTLRGKQVKKQIRMDVPKNDVGMYDVLDMIFGEDKKVELFKIAKKTTDMSGKKTITYRYEVTAEDLRARVVPSGESNSALLDKLYKDLQKEIQVEEDEEN